MEKTRNTLRRIELHLRGPTMMVTSALFAWFYATISVHGKKIITEPNTAILVTEAVLMVLGTVMAGRLIMEDYQTLISGRPEPELKQYLINED